MALLAPLAQQVAARTAPSSPAPPTPAGAGTRSTSTWSAADTRRAALAGGLAALLVLATFAGASATRSATLVAACSDLARFPFPRFRVLPCAGLGRAGAGGLETGAVPRSGGDPPGLRGAAAPAQQRPQHAPVTPAPRLPLLPRIGGVLGTAVTKGHPWPILKAIALAILAAANALVLAFRWRLQRFQAR